MLINSNSHQTYTNWYDLILHCFITWKSGSTASAEGHSRALRRWRSNGYFGSNYLVQRHTWCNLGFCLWAALVPWAGMAEVSLQLRRAGDPHLCHRNFPFLVPGKAQCSDTAPSPLSVWSCSLTHSAASNFILLFFLISPVSLVEMDFLFCSWQPTAQTNLFVSCSPAVMTIHDAQNFSRYHCGQWWLLLKRQLRGTTSCQWIYIRLSNSKNTYLQTRREESVLWAHL